MPRWIIGSVANISLFEENAIQEIANAQTQGSGCCGVPTGCYAGLWRKRWEERQDRAARAVWSPLTTTAITTAATSKVSSRPVEMDDAIPASRHRMLCRQARMN